MLKKIDVEVKVKGHQSQILKNAQNGLKHKNKGLKKFDFELKAKVIKVNI